MKLMKKLIKEVLEEKTLIKNSSIVGIATSISLFILFLANLFLSKIFGPELFGTFKTLIYLGSLIINLIDLGITLTLTKYVAEFKVKNKNKINYLILSLTKIKFVIFVIAISFIFLFKSQISFYFLHDISYSYLIIPLLFLIGINFMTIFQAIVKGYENFAVASISVIAGNIIYFLLVLLLKQTLEIQHAIIGLGISSIVSSLICLNYLIKQGFFKMKYRKFNVKKIFINYSLPLHILSIPNYLINAIVPILSLIFSIKLMGYYSFAFMFYFIPSIASGSLSSVLFSKISRLNGLEKYDDEKNTLKRVFILYTIFSVFGILGTFLFSELFISLIAPEYLPGIDLFKFLISFGFLSGYGTIMNFYLNAKEKLKKAGLVLLITTVLLFLISFILLKKI